MEQVDVLAGERAGNRDLFGERVVARGLGDRTEILPERLHRLVIVGPAENHVLRVAIHLRQLAKQVADVGADAEIVKLPGVDADAHC